MNVNGLRVHIVSFCWITEAINAGGYGYITSSAPFFKLSRCSLILICHYRDVCPQQNKHRHRMKHKLLSVNRFFFHSAFCTSRCDQMSASWGQSKWKLCLNSYLSFVLSPSPVGLHSSAAAAGVALLSMLALANERERCAKIRKMPYNSSECRCDIAIRDRAKQHVPTILQ